MRSKAADGAENLTGVASRPDFVGDPGDCDLCGSPLGGELFFCDAELPAQGGRWGMLCKSCTDSEGVRPAWGSAQIYERLDGSVTGQSTCDGCEQLQWRCVAGKSPVDADFD